MRKKYLSALLFGALLFASAGTFTSCKDYDDDINNLQTQVTDVKNAVAELQKLIGDGKFVTNVVAENNGLKITWNDGQSTIIENVINGEAQKGDVITFDSETGEILINGEGTGYYASKDAETGEIKVPYVNADGALVLINEKGEEVVTNILTSPVTAVENSDGSVTLTIRANGTTQSVIIPSAASMLSEVELVGYQKLPDDLTGTGTKENGFYTMHVGNIEARPYRVGSSDYMKDWKGNKPKLVKDDVTCAYDMNGLVARIAPSQVDAKELNFSLVNTLGEEAPIDITLTDFTNGDKPLTRANSTNSMYNVKFDCVVVNDPDGSSFSTETFGTSKNPILFSMKEASGLISKADIAIKTVKTDFTIKNVYLVDPNGNKVDPQDYTASQSGKENINTANVNAAKQYTVCIDDAPFVYDAYLEFKEDQALYWQVEYNQAEAPMSFSIKRMPDTQTPAPLEIIVHYAQMDGHTGVRYVYVTPQTNLTGVQLCDMIDHDIEAYDTNDLSKNSVVVPLDAMVTSLGNDGYITWKADADLKTTADLTKNMISIVTSDDLKPIADKYTVKFLDKDNETTEDASKATSVRFTFQNAKAIDLDKDYIAVINFASNKTNKYYNNIVNTVNFPVQFSIPAFTDLLQKDMNVFDEKGEVASAYLLEGYDTNTNKISTTTYKFNGAFEHLADNTAKGFTFNLALDENDKNKIVDNLRTIDVACLTTNANNADEDVQTSISVNKDNANLVAISLKDTYKYKAYGKELIVKLTDAYYCDVYKYDDTIFKIKLLSPIKEGKLVANGGAISIAATGITNITAEDVWATTVNENVKYDLFKTAVKSDKDGKYYGEDWYRQDVANVVFSSDRIKFIVENVNGKPTNAVVDETTGAIKEASSISLRSVGNKGDRDKLKITVTDIWGYTLEDEVDVVVE